MVDEYEYLPRISFGDVWKAKERATGKLVAIYGSTECSNVNAVLGRQIHGMQKAVLQPLQVAIKQQASQSCREWSRHYIGRTYPAFSTLLFRVPSWSAQEPTCTDFTAFLP